VYFYLKNKDGLVIGLDFFGEVKFKTKKVIIDRVVEVYPFKDRLLIKTPRSQYLEPGLVICVWRIDRRPGTHVELETYECNGSMLHISD
jgi:hypothetical protein